MGHFVFWFLLCAGVSLVWAQAPVKVLMLVLTLRVVVPFAANSLLVGSAAHVSGIDGASWLMLVYGCVSVVSNTARQLPFTSRYPGISATFGLLVCEACILTLATHHAKYIGGYVDQLVAPMIFLAVTVQAARRNPKVLRSVATTLLALAILEAALGIAQSLTHSLLVFDGYQVRAHTWLVTDGFQRAQGTLDSPLDLALLMLAAVPCITLIQTPTLRYIVAGLLLAGSMVSEARLGTVLLIVSLTYTLVFERGPASRRTVALILVPVIMLGLITSSIGAGLVSRAANDNGSSATHASAYKYFRQQIPAIAVFGYGSGAATQLQETNAIASSFESGYLIYAYDFGLLFVGVLLAVQLYLATAQKEFANPPVHVIAALCTLVMVAFYSSFESESASSLLIWVVLALRGIPRGRQARTTVLTGRSGGAEVHPSRIVPHADVFRRSAVRDHAPYGKDGHARC